MSFRSLGASLLLAAVLATGCAASPSLVTTSEVAVAERPVGDAPAVVAPVVEIDRLQAIADLEAQAFLTFGDASCVIDEIFEQSGTYNLADPLVTESVDTGALIESCVITGRPPVDRDSQPAAAAEVPAPTPTPVVEQIRVLFVGNSYTHYNDMPETVDLITNAHGLDIRRTMKAPGGYFLSDHVRDGEVVKALASGEYDVVVIQEQSVAPSLIPEMFDLTMPFAKTLDAAADEAGVRVIWYQTWGRENGLADVGFQSYEQMQQSVIQGYREIAQATGGQIAAVGESWRNIRASDTGLDLYTDDGSHPSRIGSYVAAVQIAEAILQAPVTDPPTTRGVDAETVALILAAG